ncbi:hypothetical protein BJX64DRAFT_191982 [Aspergillus heterothallicus]
MQSTPDPLRESVESEFTAAGFTPSEIETVLAQQASLRNGTATHQKDRLDLYRKPTWIKVHRKHIAPETLEAYHLPWEYDRMDEDWVLIRKWLSLELQEELFAHSRQLREGGGPGGAGAAGGAGGVALAGVGGYMPKRTHLTELRVNDRRRGHQAYGGKKGWIYK